VMQPGLNRSFSSLLIPVPVQEIGWEEPTPK